jgi:hypothetical protein
MYSLKDTFESIKNLCRLKKLECRENSTNPTKDIFDQDWEVFVVKYDMETEKFIGKTACCALEPV